MADYSAPSKLVGERITLTFNFTNKLLWGETLTIANCSVIVGSGTDSAPDEILYLSPVINMTIVTQQVYRGIPGVIYKVICSGTGSLGHLYTKCTYLAILPDDAVAQPLIFNGQIITVEMSSGA